MKQTFIIKDFKLFEEQSVTLKNLTVLAGSNSVGKSTIIQALLLSRTTLEERLKYGNDVRRIPISLNGPFLLELGNTYEVVRRGKRIADSTFEFSLFEGDELQMKIVLFGDRSDRNHYELLTVGDEFPGAKKGMLGQKIYYLCAERIGPRLKYEYEILVYLHAGYKGERTFQILSGENFPVNTKMLFGNEEPALLFDQARKWLEHIIPGASFDNAIPVGKSKVIEGTFAESLPTNVGFGISYVLPIIVNGLLAEPDTIMIVENPEAHLHPLGQSRIGKFLAQVAGSGLQVIVETHSEHVINGIRIATLDGTISNNDIIVNFVSKQEGNIPQIKEIDVTELGDLTSYPRGFFDQEQSDIATIINYKIKKTQPNV